MAVKEGKGVGPRRKRIAAGSCIFLAIILCVCIGSLAGLGWFGPGERRLLDVLTVEKYPFLVHWLQALQIPFQGQMNQLEIYNVADATGKDLFEIEKEFRERDPDYDEFLEWGMVLLAPGQNYELTAGSVVTLSDGQEAAALLYEAGAVMFISVQSWLPDDSAAETFLLAAGGGADGVDMLYLGEMEGALQIGSEGVNEVMGFPFEYDGDESPDGETNPAVEETAGAATGICLTTVWEDYRRCIATNSNLMGYRPGRDCVPNLSALQRVWEKGGAAVPSAALRALVQCGSPAVQCMPAALDNPPQGMMLNEPELIQDSEWRSCEGGELAVVPMYQVNVLWEDDRKPFESSGEQTHTFPASNEVVISVEDCAGFEGSIVFELGEEWSQELIPCSSGYCAEHARGQALCEAVEVDEPWDEGRDEGPGPDTDDVEEIVRVEGSIRRVSDACSILEGACSVEAGEISLSYPSGGGQAQGDALYSESYPSRTCGPNTAVYTFNLEGLYNEQDGFTFDWEMERTIILQGGLRGNCRTTSSVLSDSGESDAVLQEDGAYEGELILQSGERFIYEYYPVE